MVHQHLGDLQTLIDRRLAACQKLEAALATRAAARRKRLGSAYRPRRANGTGGTGGGDPAGRFSEGGSLWIGGAPPPPPGGMPKHSASGDGSELTASVRGRSADSEASGQAGSEVTPPPLPPTPFLFLFALFSLKRKLLDKGAEGGRESGSFTRQR